MGVSLWQAWQAWRRAEGRHPVKRKDGRGVKTGDEVALWKSIMEELYGGLSEEEEEEEDSSPQLEPDAGQLAVVRPGAVGGLQVGSGAGGASPRPSSAGTGAAGTDELLKMMNQVFRPDTEELGAYMARITRLAMALKSLGHELSAAELGQVTLKAELVQEAFDEDRGMSGPLCGT